MSYFPLNFEQLNIATGSYTPNSVKSFNNKTFAFWERALFQRALSVLKITLPEEWNGSIKDFFDYCLYKFGFVVVFDTAEFGKLFQPACLSGWDVWYRPTTATVNNPALISLPALDIGKNCEVLKLTPDYMGIWDIISYYAEKLSLLDNAINMSLINNKFAFFLFSKNKSSAEAFKKAMDLVNRGEPAVVLDKKVLDDPQDGKEPWQFLDRPHLKESYLTTMQLEDFRTLLHNFDTEIGIPTLPVEKKERMITDEANSLRIDAVSRSEVWLNTFNESAIAVNKMFGLNIKAERANIPEGGAEDEQRNNDTDRTV